MRVDQAQKIIKGYLQNSGRGGFLTGVVLSTSPLKIQAENKLPLDESSLYVTDNCIGLTVLLKHTHTCPACGETKPTLKEKVILRPALKPGDGVLLLCRPGNVDGVKYIILDRIQPYIQIREVDAK